LLFSNPWSADFEAYFYLLLEEELLLDEEELFYVESLDNFFSKAEFPDKVD
jgi:hypothetical protein